MTWNDLLGLISTTALTMPILVLFFTRLASYRTFPFLVAYYAAAIVCNMLAQGYVHASPDVRKTISIVNNFLDTIVSTSKSLWSSEITPMQMLIFLTLPVSSTHRDCQQI